MLEEKAIERIEAAYRAQGNRVFQIKMDEGIFVVKGQRPSKDPLRYWIIRFFAKMIRNVVLRPTPQQGGDATQRIEVKRLDELRRANVRVPECVHVGADYIVLKYLSGQMLDSRLHGPGQDASQVFELGLKAIIDVHRKNQSLGQPFARNMMIDGERIHFIDFEEDLVAVMTLEQQQARDLILFMLSCVWHREDLWPQWHMIWHKEFKALDSSVKEEVLSAIKTIKPFRFLPGGRKVLGRDLSAIKLCAIFLDRYGLGEMG